jgi:hypothetical protein
MGDDLADLNAKLIVDFGASGNSHEYLRAGWYRAEPNHTWTDGVESAIEIPRPSRPGVYLLDTVVAPFVWDGRSSQPLTVEINGTEVGTYTVRNKMTIECRLPWFLLEGRDSVSVKFKHPGAAVPNEVQKGNNDRRTIAIAFHTLTLARSLDSGHGRRIDPPAAGAVAERKQELPLAELAMQFENLGENCEFGLVQRRCGAEPLGLLRFSSTPVNKLIEALDMRFEELGRPDLIDVRASVNGKEYMVFDKKFGFLYHPWVSIGQADAKAIHAREAGRLPFLVTKLIEDLEEGRKIFVYKGMRPLSESTVRRLVTALRRYSTVTLLWVELQDAENPAGTVKELAPGLLKGYIDRFAPGENAPDLSFDMWVTICRNAHALAQNSAVGAD